MATDGTLYRLENSHHTPINTHSTHTHTLVHIGGGPIGALIVVAIMVRIILVMMMATMI